MQLYIDIDHKRCNIYPIHFFSEKATQGDIRLGFTISKGQLEVEVVCAKGLPLSASGNPPGQYN